MKRTNNRECKTMKSGDVAASSGKNGSNRKRGRWAMVTMLGLAIGAMSVALVGPSCTNDANSRMYSTDVPGKEGREFAIVKEQFGAGPVDGALFSSNGGRADDQYLFAGGNKNGEETIVDYSVQESREARRGAGFSARSFGGQRAYAMVTGQGGAELESPEERLRALSERLVAKSRGPDDADLGRSSISSLDKERKELLDEIRELRDVMFGPVEGDTLNDPKDSAGFGGLPTSAITAATQAKIELDQRMKDHLGEVQLAHRQAAERGWEGRVADELWVIERPKARLPASPFDNAPGCGALMCRRPVQVGGDGVARTAMIDVPVPLKHTDVRAAIHGYISSVHVTQTFHNPYDSKIEAVYVFPLPQNAAVSDFLMTIGDRTIRGIIREREEAQRIYEQARAQGHVASLLTQERANIFMQKVANIEPNKQIDIEITYFNTLDYRDGGYEFVFPMVVGPRFNPPGSAQGVAAVERGALPGAGGQATQISYLRPEERSGHDISLEVELDAGVSIEAIACRTHVVEIERDNENPRKARIKLSSNDSLPNRDFVLRWEVAGDSVKTGALVQTTERGTFMNLMIVPPASLESCQRGPVEMVFVMDCSGSMSGAPMAQAKSAAVRALRRLQAGDSFQVIRFSNNASQLGEYPVEATKENIERGVRYVQQLSGGGGTMMIEGIKAALDFPHDAERTRYVVFLTDGYIGNEPEILRAVHDRLGPARVFSFGVGSSTNRMLMHRMAKLGRGVVAFLDPSDSASDVMDLFMDRVEYAALTDIKLDMPLREMPAIYPSRLPDVFVGRPVMITMQLAHAFTGPLTVRGRAGGEELAMTVHPEEIEGEAETLARVWARARITDLMDRMTWDQNVEIPGQVRETALDYGMMSQFTAFVAVDSLSQTDGTFGTSVPVPVPAPEGVQYSTTVPSR